MYVCLSNLQAIVHTSSSSLLFAYSVCLSSPLLPSPSSRQSLLSSLPLCSALSTFFLPPLRQLLSFAVILAAYPLGLDNVVSLVSRLFYCVVTRCQRKNHSLLFGREEFARQVENPRQNIYDNHYECYCYCGF